jgi:hypothetical protein
MVNVAKLIVVWTGLRATALAALVIWAANESSPTNKEAADFAGFFLIVGWLIGIPIIAGVVIWADHTPPPDPPDFRPPT